ncbi:hypothetical protein M0802_012422 [Mischocyttarus mexicanus]|nr:hypothetical protein M0802_012422 [Mischocyttarus mexicanus]
MSRRLRSANVLLEKINDIDAECSEDDEEILDMEIDNTENYDPLETDSNTDENEENISNREKCIVTMFSTCAISSSTPLPKGHAKKEEHI